METTRTTNPVVEAVVNGTAPRQARLAAARGLLPLSQSELLGILVALRNTDDAELAATADATLNSQETEDLLIAAKDEATAVRVLEYFARNSSLSREVHEATVLNTQTPDEAIVELAATSNNTSLLEFIALNQGRLIRAPAIIDAVLGNPARSPEAERRVRETRREFFEKERGARQIAEELRARGNNAAAEFFESAESSTSGELSLEDALLIAQHIEVVDEEIDDSWLPAERYVELTAETNEEHVAAVKRILDSDRMELGDVSPERVSLIRSIMFMNTRDRMKLAMKGDREARGILVRDPNKVVCAAVINNPRVTDQEVENIAAMRSVSDEVLRLIAVNRSWARSYPIIHNLVRNPRCPLPTVMGLLPRIRAKDLQNLSQNRNVSDAVRRQALRISQTRSGN